LPKQNYLLDACALLAFYDSEEGADVVSGLIDSAERGEITLSMNAANLIEVYYDRVRKLGSVEADDTIRNIYEDSPISGCRHIRKNNCSLLKKVTVTFCVAWPGSGGAYP